MLFPSQIGTQIGTRKAEATENPGLEVLVEEGQPQQENLVFPTYLQA
jgi:hypothetical protein